MRALVAELNAALLALTPPRIPLPPDRRADGADRTTTVFVARDGGRRSRLGCAASPWRRRGRSEAHVHTALHRGQRDRPGDRASASKRWRATKGSTRLVLETGDRHPAAWAVYERGGFTRCGAGARLSRFRFSRVLRKEDCADRMTDLTKLTICRSAQDSSAPERLRAAELTDAYLAAIDSANPDAQRLCRRDARQGARDGQGIGREARAKARAAHSKASRSASRICSAPKACTPRRAAMCSTASSRATNRP